MSEIAMHDDEHRTIFITTRFASCERKSIEDWRRQHTPIPSRSDAIRELIRRGLATEKDTG